MPLQCHATVIIWQPVKVWQYVTGDFYQTMKKVSPTLAQITKELQIWVYNILPDIANTMLAVRCFTIYMQFVFQRSKTLLS